MSGDGYLQNILQREAVDTSATSPVRSVATVILPSLREWAGSLLRSVNASGSFAKGTANRSGTDIDLFISLSSDTNATLKDIFTTLQNKMQEVGLKPKAQNVSINVRVNGYDVDLVPARHHGGNSEYHWLYWRRTESHKQTNIAKHITTIVNGGRIQETRIIKLWRNQKALDFPSFYLELTVLSALAGSKGTLSQNVWKVFEYLRDNFAAARVVDPSNTNNIISDVLTAAEKKRISDEASRALSKKTWGEIVV